MYTHEDPKCRQAQELDLCKCDVITSYFVYDNERAEMIQKLGNLKCDTSLSQPHIGKLKWDVIRKTT